MRDTPIERLTKPTHCRRHRLDFDMNIFARVRCDDGLTLKIDVTGRGVKLPINGLRDPPPIWALVLAFLTFLWCRDPGAHTVLSNMIVTIEQHVDFIFNCLDFLRTSGFTTIEAEADAEAAWVAQCNSIAGKPFSNLQLMVPAPTSRENREIHAVYQASFIRLSARRFDYELQRISPRFHRSLSQDLNTLPTVFLMLACCLGGLRSRGSLPYRMSRHLAIDLTARDTHGDHHWLLSS